MRQDANCPTGDAAVIAAVVSGTKALVIRQPDRQDPKWKFCGGTVEEGETLAEALFREVYEETGLKLPTSTDAEGNFIVGNEEMSVEELGDRLMGYGSRSHMQYFFLIAVRDERDILFLDRQIRKEDETESIETGILDVRELRSRDDFLHSQLPLIDWLYQHIGLYA